MCLRTHSSRPLRFFRTAIISTGVTIVTCPDVWGGAQPGKESRWEAHSWWQSEPPSERRALPGARRLGAHSVTRGRAGATTGAGATMTLRDRTKGLGAQWTVLMLESLLSPNNTPSTHRRELGKPRDALRDLASWGPGLLKTWPPGDLAGQGPGPLGTWPPRGPGLPGTWLPGDLASWRLGLPGTWSPGDLASLVPGLLGIWPPWHLVSRGPSCPGTWPPRDLAARGPRCPGTWPPGQLHSKSVSPQSPRRSLSLAIWAMATQERGFSGRQWCSNTWRAMAQGQGSLRRIPEPEKPSAPDPTAHEGRAESLSSNSVSIKFDCQLLQGHVYFSNPPPHLGYS